jgi:hypothetical protein
VHYRDRTQQLYVLNLLNHYCRQVFSFTSLILVKFPITLLPLLLLPFSFDSQALSATTTNTIQGSAPYLTFNNGKTKVINTEDLLAITLSDGTTITPITNTSATNPIVLPRVGETLADVGMLVPSTTDTIELKALIDAPYYYWGDDDGDGQEVNGVTAMGSLTVNITDKNNRVVGRDDTLDIARSPYKVVLSNTNSSLSTQYGVPDRSTFNAGTVTYYIIPKSSPAVLYAKPNLRLGGNNEPGFNGWKFAGPANIWQPNRGFLPQSIIPTSYNLNFPTTGANGLYFDLDISEGTQLTWPSITHEGITAIMTPNANGTRVRVLLTGPVATNDQIKEANPARIYTPALPKTFELVGYDSSGAAVIKYGFVLQKWFVSRGERSATNIETENWCTSLGYRLPQAKDFTNAVCSGANETMFCRSLVGATPASSGHHYQRQIGAGFFSEWGDIIHYKGAGIANAWFWTSDPYGGWRFRIDSTAGSADGDYPYNHNNGLCIYP